VDLPKDWNQDQWNAEFQRMKGSCLTQLIIQATADSKEKKTFYPTSLANYTQLAKVDIVGPAFTAAAGESMDVFLGLQGNSDFDHGDRKYANDAAWIDVEAAEAIKIATDLFNRYHDTAGFKKSFQGWYLSFELDNANFPKPNTPSRSWDNMARFYTTVGDALHTLTPGKVVMISPYFNVDSDPTPNSVEPSPSLKSMAHDWEEMLSYILTRSSIDVLALQDGVGAKERDHDSTHSTLAQLPTMFEATRRAIKSAHKDIKLWANTETYVENREGPTERYPMLVGEIVADMRAVQPYVSNYVSFSFNHYLSRPVYEAYYQTYRNYVVTGTLDALAPTAPSNLLVTDVDASAVNLNWKAGADNIGVVGYSIYRNLKKIRRIFLGEPRFGTSFIDSNQLQQSTKYQYEVAEIDAAGNESPRSNRVSASTAAFLENVAEGKSYTVSLASASEHPDNGCVVESGIIRCAGDKGLLTNGSPQPGEAIDYAMWQGRNTEDTYFFILDLGSAHLIKEINSDWLQVKKDFIFLPRQVVYYVSLDNNKFEEAGTVNKPNITDADQVWRYRKTDLNKTGRFVKIEVRPTSGWSFVGEAQVLQSF
jgi:hypothetical protein